MAKPGEGAEQMFELFEEICQFMESRGKNTTELRNIRLWCEWEFLCDITTDMKSVLCAVPMWLS